MLSCVLNYAAVSPLAGIRPAQQTEADKAARQTRLLLENCLKQAEELDYLTAKVATLTKLDAQSKELVAALDSQIAAQEKTITALKAANAAGDKIGVIDAKELKSYEASLADAKAQIAKLTARVSFWRKVAGFGMVTMIGLGIGVGILIGGK